VFREAFDLKLTGVAVPDVSRQLKAAARRFAAALHTMARFWTAVASVARHRFDVAYGFSRNPGPFVTVSTCTNSELS
jgi:hypothetical protein